MKLATTRYQKYEKDLPQTGNHILAQTTTDTLFVFQAFNPNIAKYAIEHQHFGGQHYRFSRMSWIKPNFLWMMYRCGWAAKPDQQRVLAIELTKAHFDEILGVAVHSAYQPQIYDSREAWQEAVRLSDVRLQWDPDHGPYGQKLERRAIQLGLRGDTLRRFCTEWIVSIEDITPFVKEQGQKVATRAIDELLVIKETVYEVLNPKIRERLEIDYFDN